jgi:hypothetical protein
MVTAHPPLGGERRTVMHQQKTLQPPLGRWYMIARRALQEAEGRRKHQRLFGD